MPRVFWSVLHVKYLGRQTSTLLIITIKLIEKETNCEFLIDNLLLLGGAISIHRERQASTSKVNVTALVAVGGEETGATRDDWMIHGMFTV